MKPSGRKRDVVLKNKVTPAILAALATSILIYILYYFNFDVLYGKGASAIIFASFGSSAFILFMTPRSKSARIGAFVKSYVSGAVIGAIGFYALAFLPLYAVAALIVFVLSLLMYVIDSPHPPAIGIAIAFIIFRVSSADGVLIVIVGIAILVFLRLVLEKFVYIVEKDIMKEVER